AVPLRAFDAAAPTLAIAKRFVFADQQFEVRTFLVGELEEHLLALRILEPFAVTLEELVRTALAADADEERLRIVHSLAQLLGTFGEQPVGCTLEKQKRRTRLQLRILGVEVAIPLLQRAEVLLLLFGEPLENSAPSRIFRDARRTRVELQPASLGRNGHSQRIAGEH